MTQSTPNGISTGDTVTVADGLGTVALVTGVRYASDVVTAAGTFHYAICTKHESRAVQAGPVIIRLDSPRPGVYTIAVEYASTGQPISELGFAIDDRELAMDAYTRRVLAFDLGMTVERALETMAAANTTAQTPAAPSLLDNIKPMAPIHTPNRDPRPVARGQQTSMTEAQAFKIAEVGGFGGNIHRGQARTPGCATTVQLTAMAKRGYASLTTATYGRREVITGATVSVPGARRAAEVLRAAGHHKAADKIDASIPAI